MSEIEKMIQELCPNGVEFMQLGEVVKIYTGTQLNKRDMLETASYPVLNGGIGYSGYTHEWNEPENTIAISQGGASAGYVNWVPEKFWAGAHCYVVKPNTGVVDNRYVFHLLKHKEATLMSSKQGAGIPGLNRGKVQELIVPIPPIAVQRKIVEVLDNFSELTAELTAELEKRKLQYEYYRDNLLNFNRGGQIVDIEWFTVGDVCKISRGRVISKDYLRDNVGDYPVYSSQTANNGELGRLSTYDCEGDYLTWTTDGAYAGTIFKRSGRFSITNVCGLLEVKDTRVDLNFLYYWLSIEAKKHVYQGMGNPKLMSNVMETIPVPVFEKNEQQRITGVLDQLSLLTFDLSAGLPAEINARQKQYEYYRDKLLTFNRA